MADEHFCFPIPAAYADAEAAPLLCAGLIGYRSLKLAADPARLGIYGFGAAAHIVTQVARFQGRGVYAFTARGMWRDSGLPERSWPCGRAVPISANSWRAVNV